MLCFNIFLADFPVKLISVVEHSPNIGTGAKLNCILWADILILFLKMSRGSSMLSILSKYTKENALHINMNKTKCMVFNKTGRLMGKTFKCQDLTIKTIYKQI